MSFILQIRTYMRLILRFGIVVSIIIISQVNSYSQSVSFGFQTGLGIYSMPSLENLNQTVQGELPFNSEIVTSFPPYFNYRPMFMIRGKKYGFGISYLFQSTGSRISSRDYSANYKFDMLVKSYCPGLNFDLLLLKRKKSELSTYTGFGIVLSKLQINEKFELNNVIESNTKIKLKSNNYFIEYGLIFSFVLYKSISLGINGVYFLLLGDQAYYINNDKDLVLMDNMNKPIKPEWNGFRVGLTFFYNIGRKK